MGGGENTFGRFFCDCEDDQNRQTETVLSTGYLQFESEDVPHCRVDGGVHDCAYVGKVGIPYIAQPPSHHLHLHGVASESKVHITKAFDCKSGRREEEYNCEANEGVTSDGDRLLRISGVRETRFSGMVMLNSSQSKNSLKGKMYPSAMFTGIEPPSMTWYMIRPSRICHSRPRNLDHTIND